MDVSEGFIFEGMYIQNLHAFEEPQLVEGIESSYEDLIEQGVEIELDKNFRSYMRSEKTTKKGQRGRNRHRCNQGFEEAACDHREASGEVEIQRSRFVYLQ